MAYTEVIYLISKVYSQDDVGNVTSTDTEKKTYAILKNVTTKEFYTAVESGITPTYEFQIRSTNYAGEEEIKYNGSYYHVIRAIRKSVLDIVLVVEKKAGDS